MVYRMIGLCCLALLVPGIVRAQTAAKTPEELTKDVLDLQQKLTTATANLTKLAEQVAKNTEAATRNSQGIERLTTVINEELRKQQDILERIDQLTQQQQDQLARQQAILDTISQKDAAGATCCDSARTWSRARSSATTCARRSINRWIRMAS